MDKIEKKIITPLSLVSIIFAVTTVMFVLFSKILMYYINYDTLQWMPYVFSLATIITAGLAISSGKSQLVLPVISLILSAWWVIALLIWFIAIAFFHLPPW